MRHIFRGSQLALLVPEVSELENDKEFLVDFISNNQKAFNAIVTQIYVNSMLDFDLFLKSLQQKKM